MLWPKYDVRKPEKASVWRLLDGASISVKIMIGEGLDTYARFSSNFAQRSSMLLTWRRLLDCNPF
jgi:hypothetical protein